MKTRIALLILIIATVITAPAASYFASKWQMKTNSAVTLTVFSEPVASGWVSVSVKGGDTNTATLFQQHGRDQTITTNVLEQHFNRLP